MLSRALYTTVFHHKHGSRKITNKTKKEKLHSYVRFYWRTGKKFWLEALLACWFASHSAFNNFMQKSVVSQNMANPSTQTNKSEEKNSNAT